MDSLPSIPVFAFILLATCAGCNSGTQEKQNPHADHAADGIVSDTVKKSIPREVHAQVGKAHVMMHYHAPSVRNRTIWGGLVPFGEVWVSGAHNATSIEFDKPIRLARKEIPSGKYAFFTIPGESEWTIILNKNWKQHLADDYDAGEDVIRFSVTPIRTENLQERLYYDVIKTNESQAGTIRLRWEKIVIDIPFEVI